MSIGTLFSFCAGILIGLRLYYKHFYKQKKAEPENVKSGNENRKYMDILKGNNYITDESVFSKKDQIFQDLWYGDSKLWLITQLPYYRKGEKDGPDC